MAKQVIVLGRTTTQVIQSELCGGVYDDSAIGWSA
jgi:hypothetical protein